MRLANEFRESLKLYCGKNQYGRDDARTTAHRFRRQWGAEEVQLFWYTIPLQAQPARPMSGENPKWTLMSRIWRRLPVPISRMLDPKIRQYLTQ